MLLRTLFALLAAAHVSPRSVIIDDADPHIQYFGLWIPHTGVNSTLYWSGTVTYTNVTGAVATLSFTGNSVSVSGAFTPVGSYNMHSEYSIDGGPATEFRPPSDVETGVYKRTFFTSAPLPYGPHTLTITNLGDQFWLDAIDFDVPDVSSSSGATGATTAPSSSGAPTPPAAAQNPSSPSGISTGASSSSSMAAPPPASPAAALSATAGADGDRQSSPVVSGVIAGAAVAGVILALFVLLGWLLWRRRRRQRRASLDVLPCMTPFDSHEHGALGTRGLATAAAETKGLALGLPQGRVSTNMPLSASLTDEASPEWDAAALYDGPERHDAPEKHSPAPENSSTSLSPLSSIPHLGAQPSHEDNRSALRQEGVEDPSRGLPLVWMPHDSLMTRTTGRRRSLDGGLRLAGGLAGEEGGATNLNADAMSTASTLPPSYQMTHCCALIAGRREWWHVIWLSA